MNERIKKLRMSLGLTQAEFAKRIGVKRNTVATYELGRHTPIDAIATLICREFQVNEEWLRTGEGEMFIEQQATEDSIEIGNRIKYLRELLKITQQDFAYRIRIKQNTVASYESGRIKPSPSVISLICKEFDVNECWISSGKGTVFLSKDIAVLNELAKHYNLNEESMKFISDFCNLSPDAQGLIRNYVTNNLLTKKDLPDQEDQ